MEQVDSVQIPPQAAPPKKTGWLVLIIVLLLVIAGGLYYWFVLRGDNTNNLVNSSVNINLNSGLTNIAVVNNPGNENTNTPSITNSNENAIIYIRNINGTIYQTDKDGNIIKEIE